jgi:CheY-like chemotaxis protein
MPKLLIVEDNEMNWDMLSRRLVRSGYETIIATDGLQGIGMAQTESPDLILMDLTLPVLSGMDAIRRLKQDCRTKAIPVIALTAHALAPDRDEAMRAGCDDYDTKPIALPRLLEKIERLLGAKGPS